MTRPMDNVSSPHLGIDTPMFRQAMEAAGCAILITDADVEAPGPTIRFANAAMADLTGYSVEELCGGNPRILQGPGTDRATLDDLRNALLEQRSFKGEAVNYRKDGSAYFVAWDINPVFGETGLEAWIAIQHDVTRPRQDRTARKESEDRLRAIFSNASVGLSVVDRDGRFLRANHELCRILGRSEAEVLAESILGVTYPDDLPPSLAAVAEAIATGTTRSLDKRYQRRDGTLVWANSSVTPLSDAQDQPGDLLVVTTDLTGRKQAEDALRESDERFRQFAAATSDVLWIRDVDTLRMEYASPALRRVYGLPMERAVGGRGLKAWIRLVVPEDRRTALNAVRRARAGEDVTCDFRIVRPSDGQVRWVRDTSFPIRDKAGQQHLIGGISADATEAKEGSDRLEVLVAELQHRTRNLMGVVQSVADGTVRSSADLPDFRVRFRDRLRSLARVQGLLSRLSDVDRVTFDDLIEAELSAMEGSPDRVTLEGPTGVRLRSSTVQTLAMALHELATNAVKYGAFSQPDGRLSVRWRFEANGPDGKPWLHIDWRESGVAMPRLAPQPGGTGQGRELIEEALPYQLKARTTFELGADGVRCTISIPVSETRHVEDAQGA